MTSTNCLEQNIRQVIQEFLKDRLEKKLEKETDEERRRTLEEEHRVENWIPKAAHRVTQLQQVTHAIKYTHSDARGTCLYSVGNAEAGSTLIGTHTLNGNSQVDVVGAASALDVDQFLSLQVEGKSLLEYAIEGNPAFIAAFPENEDLAKEWIKSFKTIIEPKETLNCHTLAKQVYWPLENGEYHLLAPLFPTSLVHNLWETIREDRFSESAKEARKAKRAKEHHSKSIRDYLNIVLQKFGGSQPQNISLLNRKRDGESYLLASVPPNWQSEKIPVPMKVETIFGRPFGSRKRVQDSIEDLRKLLRDTRNANNVRIRNRRAGLVGSIQGELIQFSEELRSLPPGWSSHEDCRLNQEECYWLDPNRAEQDEMFALGRKSYPWADEVCRRFGNWLNARLEQDQMHMSDPEQFEWASLMKKELHQMSEELNDE
ncbi:CRISPR-associated protein Csy1 [Gammaproteobacteria bacterium]